jgi:hypothetical protein
MNKFHTSYYINTTLARSLTQLYRRSLSLLSLSLSLSLCVCVCVCVCVQFFTFDSEKCFTTMAILTK